MPIMLRAGLVASMLVGATLIWGWVGWVLSVILVAVMECCTGTWTVRFWIEAD